MTTRSNIVCTPEMDAMLHADNVDGFVDALMRMDSIDKMLGGWMHANVLHAIASCPKVLAFWKDKMEWESEPGLAVLRFLGEALETIPEDEKIALLCGEQNSALACEWHRGMANPQFFERLSPAWIGPEGSALRTVMVGHGWTPLSLRFMIGHGKPANTGLWSEWVPFVETMRVHNHAQMENLMERAGRHVGHRAWEVAPWARPDDVALAQALCGVLWPEGSHCTLTVPPNYVQAPNERRQELVQMLQVHANLDLLGPFLDILATGHLPQERAPDAFAPEQGF